MAEQARAAVRLLEVARDVLSDLDLDTVLERALEAAREVSGARFAALGVLNESRSELERFFTVGVDEQTRRRIGEPPRGRGVLGELIEHPVPLRLEDVACHPRSFGVPPGHPRMKTFLGVPVMVGAEPFGNLYLTEKRGGERFTEQDERSVVALAQLASVAIDHARRYSVLDARYGELRHTIDALDASLEIGRALGGESDLAVILGLVAERGRALVSARALVIEREEVGEMVIAATAGDLPRGLIGRRVEMRGSLAGAAVHGLRTVRLEEGPSMARFERHGLGGLGVNASAGLVVPLVFGGKSHGVLIAFDRQRGGPAFTAGDQRLLEAFAANAATVVVTAESVQADRRRQRLAAAELERARWARELHDETLQSLAALRVQLGAQLKDPALGAMAEVVRDAVAALELEIANLRSLITDLRPAALDELGAEAAIRDLAERARRRGLRVHLTIDLAYEQGREPDRLTPELETAIYRVIQEALNNAGKHGGAREASVEIEEDQASVRVIVRDDGRGFDPAARTSGFGLLGMRERAELAGGTLEIDAAPGRGTTVTAMFPLQRAGRSAHAPAG